ncbi:hypothetical protein CORC01_02154 [Colletotrichum orchidophilum]|uniref:Uncharacterized protein n=1 Tax=Colletotrichum orchidophilum TaxID=1209926 RepID=A0A1G4BLX2_9PEZI|nr:uncharacterized protein CORC01_02154 [Colletotrichum orchidophilum]OHF02459.1 hypothetical protein CORC01_02154 [Colletotrichum orchidophilum]
MKNGWVAKQQVISGGALILQQTNLILKQLMRLEQLHTTPDRGKTEKQAGVEEDNAEEVALRLLKETFGDPSLQTNAVAEDAEEFRTAAVTNDQDAEGEYYTAPTGRPLLMFTQTE